MPPACSADETEQRLRGGIAVWLQVESRPMRSQPVGGDGAGGRQFQYLFHIDFAGNLAEETAQNALRHLAEFAPFLRVLGCYPCDAEP